MPADLNQTKIDFQQGFGFPGVVGAIDGTHVKIESPGGPNAEVYRNRKSFFQHKCASSMRCQSQFY